MKRHKNELDVDFIGGAGPLTKEEEKAISEFIKASKEQLQKQSSRRKALPATPKRGTANRSITASEGQ